MNPDTEVYYYGCETGRAGHYWHAPDGIWMKQGSIIARVPQPSIGPYKVDGGFLQYPQTEGVSRHDCLGPMRDARVFVVRRLLREALGPVHEIGTLGRNENGSPKHPLFLKKTTEFQSLVKG